MSMLELITAKWCWKPYSILVRHILMLRYQIRIGANFYCEGAPRLKVKGKGKKILVGDNVQFLGVVDLRNREEGEIVIEDNVTIEDGCRFVAARNGRIVIGAGTVIGAGAVFNGGGDIRVGKNCIFAVRSSVNANDHLMLRTAPIRQQGFVYAPVVIEDDCWLGANVAVNKGVTIRTGSVIGANAVVTKDTDYMSINVGVPANKKGERTE